MTAISLGLFLCDPLPCFHSSLPQFVGLSAFSLSSKLWNTHCMTFRNSRAAFAVGFALSSVVLSPIQSTLFYLAESECYSSPKHSPGCFCPLLHQTVVTQCHWKPWMSMISYSSLCFTDNACFTFWSIPDCHILLSSCHPGPSWSQFHPKNTVPVCFGSKKMILATTDVKAFLCCRAPLLIKPLLMFLLSLQ